MPVSKDEFRAALSRFASGVTVLTSINEDNQPSGITVSAFASVSLDPPLILACVDKRASVHDCLFEGRHFAVNILAEDQEHLSRLFASKDEDRFRKVSYIAGENGAPVLDGAVAVLECRVVQAYPGGDHTIVVGEVERTVVNDAMPLAYDRGSYARLS